MKRGTIQAGILALLIIAGVIFLRCIPDGNTDTLLVKIDRLETERDSLAFRCMALSDIIGQNEITIDSLVTTAEAQLLHIADLEMLSDSLMLMSEWLRSELYSATLLVSFLDSALTLCKNISGQSLTITWDRSTEPDLAGYRVYRDGVFHVEVPDTFYKPVEAGVYDISAVDVVGNESERVRAEVLK